MKMARKVKYVRVHQNLFIPGIGDLGSVLPDPRKSFKLSMTDVDGGIVLLATPPSGVPVEARIPDGNIALVVYADITPEDKASDVAVTTSPAKVIKGK